MCGSPCDLEPSPPELVRFERGLALALLVAFLLLWKVALDATAGPADVRAPDTVADLQAAWQRGEGRGALLGLALFFTASVYCAVRFQRTIRTAMKALRARPAPTVGPVPSARSWSRSACSRSRVPSAWRASAGRAWCPPLPRLGRRPTVTRPRPRWGGSRFAWSVTGNGRS